MGLYSCYQLHQQKMKQYLPTCTYNTVCAVTPTARWNDTTNQFVNNMLYTSLVCYDHDSSAWLDL